MIEDIPLIRNIEKREYQLSILKNALDHNTLCVLPTGLGKTSIAIMLAACRLSKFPESKIIILAPTRPLAEQHQKSFKSMMNIPEEDVVLVTGKIKPEQRKEVYKNCKIIAATPQTIKNDLENEILDLSNCSLLIVDEVHRAVKKYAYPFVARKYVQISKYPRILGLTASPGSQLEKIEEIKSNLFADMIEIRTEADEDVIPYIQKTDIEYIKISFDEKMEEVHKKLKQSLNSRLFKLTEKFKVRMKGEVLDLQRKLSRKLAEEKNPVYFYYLSLSAEVLKIWHLLELFETQSITSAKKYLDRMKEEKTRAVSRILNDKEIQSVINDIEKMHAEKIEHPKISELEKLVMRYSVENKRMIIFSHFRDNIDLIEERLKKIPNCRPVKLIGQSGKTGLNQKQQISIVRDYDSGFYNCLITSSIGEEGLHLGSADIAIFYDSVSSEIRTIQRRGRVGRTKLGKVIFLLTNNTRDMANFYISKRKEWKMKTILKEMKDDIANKNQYSIKKFLRSKNL